jgi:hypothetical protein
VKATMVRYRVKPEHVAENEELVQAVFAELDRTQPEGFRYASFRLEDGTSFVHLVIEDEDEQAPASLADVPAFQHFVRDIGDRVDEAPVATGLTAVGSYGFEPR